MEKDKILVIDSDAVQAKSLEFILRRDYEVTTCQTAREGLAEARSGRYAMILTEVVMPDMENFFLLKELKAMEEIKYIPVIVITSLDAVQYEERGLLMGAVDYVAKPFSPVIIKARVKTHIQMYHWQDQFRELALVDSMTGVANRRRYEHEYMVKWQEAIRFQLPISICMMDIDHFKRYNDTFGHPAGDEVIISLAQTISAKFRRATDFFARYGGEEFVAVFLGNDGPSAFQFLKNIRQTVEDLHIQHNSPVSPWVTISVGGVSLIPKVRDRYPACLELADTMLYEAKRSGRNRVVWSNAGQEIWREK